MDKFISNNSPFNVNKKVNDIDLRSIMNFQDMKDNVETKSNLIKNELKFSKIIEDIDLDKLVEVDE